MVIRYTVHINDFISFWIGNSFFSLLFFFLISFPFIQIGHCLEEAMWSPLQFLHFWQLLPSRPSSPHLKKVSQPLHVVCPWPNRLFETTQRIWYEHVNFHLVQPILNVCWHTKGQQVSISWFNCVVTFFRKSFNRDHSLRLDFLFRNVISVMIPVKHNSLVLNQSTISQGHLPKISNLARTKIAVFCWLRQEVHQI